MIGLSEQAIKEMERTETKSSDGLLAELVYANAVSGQRTGNGGRIGELVKEKLTKDAKESAPSPTPSPLVNHLIAQNR